MQDFRIGYGEDHHQFSNEVLERGLILGGVKISNEYSLSGNSDADVILHALCNAISTAIGGHSLSRISDPMCSEKGITNSAEYLAVFLQKMTDQNYQISNISISVEAGQPRLEKHAEEISKSIASLCQLNENQVGIAFTSGEQMSDYAKGKGMAARVVVGLLKS
ncbi:MAG: 2-C-methyl-D-erythritol 2,4-cyclodiphosphate synthase [Pseudomonadales bacterium]|jgi:2-C-methyl-D-erythritol 2,4-cyclodiphosphate synthase|nr:2-C-methyl-D-erythritol 2,4-cyclodiphosphate synthase [Pseudomonadales bacterium]